MPNTVTHNATHCHTQWHTYTVTHTDIRTLSHTLSHTHSHMDGHTNCHTHRQSHTDKNTATYNAAHTVKHTTTRRENCMVGMHGSDVSSLAHLSQIWCCSCLLAMLTSHNQAHVFFAENVAAAAALVGCCCRCPCWLLLLLLLLLLLPLVVAVAAPSAHTPLARRQSPNASTYFMRMQCIHVVVGGVECMQGMASVRCHIW